MPSTASKRFFQNRGKIETAKKKAVKQLKAKDGVYFGKLMKLGNTDKDGPTKFYATAVLICDKNGDTSCEGEQGTQSIIIQDSKPDAKYPYTEADRMAQVMELWDKLGYDQFPSNDEEMEADMADVTKDKPLVRCGIKTGDNGTKYLSIYGLAERGEILELNNEIDLPEAAGGDESADDTVEDSDDTNDGGEGGEEGGEEEADTVPFDGGTEEEAAEEEPEPEPEPAKPAPKKAAPAAKPASTTKAPASKPAAKPAPAAAPATSRRRR
jgi:hypothetical protein